MNIKENYQQYVSRYASEVAALKRKNTGFITGELLAFGGILAFLICYFALDGDTQNYLMGAALCLIAYLGIRRLDDKNKEKIEHLSALLKVYIYHYSCFAHRYYAVPICLKTKLSSFNNQFFACNKGSKFFT